MTFMAPDRAIQETGLLPSLRPGRGTTMVIVAAFGTLLLTTAVAQPLLPRARHRDQAFYPFLGVAPMGGAWQALLVGLLVVGCLVAVFRAWRDIRIPAAILVTAIGIAVFLGNLLVLHPAISALDVMTERIQWPGYAALVVPAFVSCAATVWLGFARDSRDQRIASGILLAAGAYGYLSYLQQLDAYVSTRPLGAPGPGRGTFIGLLGASVVIVAGLVTRAANRPAHAAAPAGSDQVVAAGQATAGRTPVRLAKLAAVVAAVAIIVAAVYLTVFYVRSSAAFTPLLQLAALFVLYAVCPALLAVAAWMTVAQRDPDRDFAAGVLLTGCLLSLVYFSSSHVFGWAVPLQYYAGWAIVSADIGACAGFVLGLAGSALLIAADDLRGPVQAGDPAEAATAAGEAADTAPQGARTQPEMTRYLCTAPHLDDKYARRVIEEVVADPHRAVVPSLGIDMGIVVRHCFAARRRQNIRDLLITLILVAVVPVFLWLHTLAGVRDLLIAIVLAAAVAFADRWISRYLVTRQLTKERFDPAAGPWLSAAEQAQLAQVLAAEEGDVSVYGTYNPFVGSGFARGGWSFAVNLARGKQSPAGLVRLEPLPFEVDEFYQQMERDITALELSGLTVESRLLVDGQQIRDDARFLPDQEGRPVTGVGADQLLALSRTPELHNRTYQCIRLQAWDGDLVLSVFVNFTKHGAALLAEVQHYLLAPLQPDYRKANQFGTWSLGQQVRAELRGAPFAVTGTALRAPFRLGRLLARTGLRWRTERAAVRRIKANPEYNFGAMTSVRELAQSRHYRRYFQQVDRDLNTKLIDRQVLDTIMDFLEARNIDISQFAEQRTMILNNGLLISGGEFKAESVAVGSQSRSSITQIGQGVQSLLRQGGERE